MEETAQRMTAEGAGAIAHADPAYLPQILWLLLAATVVVAVFSRMRLSPVLGYLCAGALIGVHGLGLVSHDDFEVIAEFGVVFLLFMIGLELTLERLVEMRRYLFGVGTLQLVATSAAIAALCYGVAGFDAMQSLIVGSALSLSSTAVVLRVIADAQMQGAQTGRVSIAILILQDLAVVPLLVLLPKLGGDMSGVGAMIGRTLVEAALGVAAIFLIGRMIMRPLFNRIADNNELFVTAILLVILGSSFIAVYANLSLAMGAFVAGILIAGTRHQYQVSDFVRPFKDVLMGLFFMTVGMSVNVGLLKDHIATVAVLTVSLIAVKTLILAAVCRLFRMPWESSVKTALLLSQGGEFAFILFRMATQPDIGLLREGDAQMLFFVVTISMALTPLLPALEKFVAKRLNLRKNASVEASGGKQELTDLNRHVVIVGFGRSGQMTANVLKKQKIPFVALDNNAVHVRTMREAGKEVYMGSCQDPETLHRLGIERARALVVSVTNDARAEKLVRNIRSAYPSLPIVARASDITHGKLLADCGADAIVAEKCEAGLQLGAVLLRGAGMTDAEVSAIKKCFRDEGYDVPGSRCPTAIASQE
ncbi:MAG: cation:proton antiporter [Rickettsiales bacterium]